MHYLKSMGACTLILSAFGTFALAAAPTSQPSATPAATQVSDTSVDIEDYCIVLLAPKLQDHLGATQDQRNSFSQLKSKMKFYLNNSVGGFHRGDSPGLLTSKAEYAMGKIGTMVRNQLTPAQRTMLAGMFDDHTLQPIQVNVSVSYAGGEITHELLMNYTHYGETPTADSTPEPTTPATPPPAPDTNATPASNVQPLPSLPGRTPPPPPSDSSATPPPPPPSNAAPDSNAAAQSPPSHHGHHGEDLDIDIPAALQQLTSDSVPDEMVALAQLENATPDDQYRAKVLAIVRPYVQDPTDDYWPTYVRVYCWWADAKEVKTIKWILVVTDMKEGVMRKQQPAAAACCALLSMDPAAAIDAINARNRDVSFRGFLIGDVQKLPGFQNGLNVMANRVFQQLMSYVQGHHTLVRNW